MKKRVSSNDDVMGLADIEKTSNNGSREGINNNNMNAADEYGNNGT